MDTPDLAQLLPSWELALRAERKSAETLKSYGLGVRQFLAWCERTGSPTVLTKAAVAGFTADLLDNGAEASTARSRQLAIKRFSAWLADEGETDRDELLGLKPPKLDIKIVDPLTDDQLRALIKTCQGRDFRELRDMAIVRFMAETGCRAGEVVGLEISDVDLSRGLAVVRRSKTGRGRLTPFGPQTGRAIDRYLRARRTHRLANTPTLWLGDRGKNLGYQGLYSALLYRAGLAGIANFHPHRMRHTAATRWLSAGGSEGGLMAVAGWTRRDMIDRYTRATASERAAAEAASLNLGDL
ncbi:tyrosine-type recombinase/integrase [Nocardia cyriacigeorgica]|uniref:tyrosine-type recombinase/integrase n=1 Tax=Nocardia cyriacigeorgica TaxID=135487 RepID=UPI0013BD42FD|nr:tyrosine-type recombinase/integrase [Nocardia cyriacigeorgica]NEW49958.1 tyrosine-type recombinase/integrase [Nocardia cyriacigeorgica]